MSTSLGSSDPFRGFNFTVTVNGSLVGGFSEVTVSDITVDTIEYREGDAKTSYRTTLSGLTKYGPVSLKRGVTKSTYLSDWHSVVVQSGTSASGVRRKVVIQLLDTDFTTAAEWQLYDAWPIVYQVGAMNASTAEVMIETLQLAINYMKRTK